MERVERAAQAIELRKSGATLRKLQFRFDDGSLTSFGAKPQIWLFGVGCSRRAALGLIPTPGSLTKRHAVKPA
jgi:hypothetical protein